MKEYRYMSAIVAVGIAVSLSCSGLQPDPETARRYPWLVQPLRPETRAYFCEKLDLEPDHPVCNLDRDVLAVDLLYALQQRFPVNETPYAEVEAVLEGYPVEAEESITPGGTITGRTYVYLLTEFDGFCVYFDVDLQTGIVTRLNSSSIGSGPTRTVCGSLDLRQQPRPFLPTITPENGVTPR